MVDINNYCSFFYAITTFKAYYYYYKQNTFFPNYSFVISEFQQHEMWFTY